MTAVCPLQFFPAVEAEVCVCVCVCEAHYVDVCVCTFQCVGVLGADVHTVAKGFNVINAPVWLGCVPTEMVACCGFTTDQNKT